MGPGLSSARISGGSPRLTGPADAATPRLILWPEAATPDFLSIEPGARRRLAALIGPRDLLLLGGVELIFGADGRADRRL